MGGDEYPIASRRNTKPRHAVCHDWEPLVDVCSDEGSRGGRSGVY